ncbi:HlyD family secretion protein [Shimwellia pseudoproteus]|uniref:HlyD family secretion protein n=1 Tax=Shimwellia pseudoproteus TaxID=570012 RepID=UPI0018EA4744|nr:HlyD family secretion protein [Shimwellia pseudoproteus]MBJ3816515.1 HlyD family secretion protein [Shimwellia pseudoproteus]
MELLLILCYTALCMAIFKIFRIPLNKWTVPTAVLGGVMMIGLLVLVMNYNYPYTQIGNQVYRSVPIVSQVRGRVISVPVKSNQMLDKGAVLFEIDPTPFQARVNDLKAQLKDASQNALTLSASLSGSQADLAMAVAERDKAQREYARYLEGHKMGAFSDQMIDTRRQAYKAAQAAVESASAKVSAARNSLESVINGKNTKVASLVAQLQEAEFDLTNTVVRAPSDGFVSTVGLRPGTMSTALGINPVMTFIPRQQGESQVYVAAFRQNSYQSIKRGSEAEFLFPSIPGKVFTGSVVEVLPAIGESQFQGQGTLLETDDLKTDGRLLVILNVTDKRLARYALPRGMAVEVAVYSGNFAHLALLRKILIRMKSWESYLYLDH